MSEKSWPHVTASWSRAASEASHAIASPTHSGGMCASQSSLETGFTPEALMLRCMSVATVPGDRPTTRMPCSAYSLWVQRVSDRTAALVAQ